MCRVKKEFVLTTFDVGAPIFAKVVVDDEVWLLIEAKKSDLCLLNEFDVVKGVATRVVEAWFRIGRPMSTIRAWAYFYEMNLVAGEFDDSVVVEG